MTRYVKVDGAWKNVDATYVKVDGVWKTVDQMWVSVGGKWRPLSVPVPYVIGMSPATADSVIASASLVKGSTSFGYTSDPALDNKVGSQSPAAGTLVVPGSAVNYTFTTYLATPPTPTLAYAGATGVFTITNYNAAYIYTISSGSRSGSTLYLPSNQSSASVSAQSFGGGQASAIRTYENKPFSYTADTRYSYPNGTYECNCRWKNCGCACGGPGGDCSCYGNSARSYGQCGCPAYMCWYNWGCDQCTSYASGGSAPQLIDESGNGYTNGGSEWYKIT